MDEVLFERLVDDVNGKQFTVRGKTFTIKAVPSDEFQEFEQPTVAIAINDHSPGYGGMHNLHSIDSDGTYNFTRAMRADVEFRMTATEQKKGAVIIHARDITKAMLDVVKQRLFASWDKILIEYHGSVMDTSIMVERDLYRFMMADNRSARMLRVVVQYQEAWTRLLPTEVAGNTKVTGVELRAEDDLDEDTEQDVPTIVTN